MTEIEIELSIAIPVHTFYLDLHVSHFPADKTPSYCFCFEEL